VPAERAVWSVMVVEVGEPVVGAGALLVGAPGSDVGPFFEQDPVEPFDFAVGLRPVGAGAFVSHAGVVECCRPEA
jgi:hypothetical protein